MCSISGEGPVAVQALGQIRAALDAAADAPLWALPDDQLPGFLTAHEQLSARLAELGCRAVREADARGLAKAQGATSTTAWLRHRLNLRPGEAKARVAFAAALDATLPTVRTALAAGRLGLEHARVIHRTLAKLPAHVDPATRAEAEAFLVAEAELFDPAQLARLGIHLHTVLDPDGAERAERRQADEFTVRDRGDGRYSFAGSCGPETAALINTALDPLAAPRPAADGSPDPRTPAQRRADALAELCRRALDAGDQLPTTRGARPHVIVTAGLDTLRRQPGAPAADTTWGGPLSPETLRRIACDASVTVIITDHAGVPLNVGRAHRTVTPGIWAALLVRDRGCTFPTCTRPPSWCQAHHRTHWSDGGETSLDNCCLLCAFHHRVVHHDGWDTQLGPDGRPQYLPPPWIDPDRKPRRNTYWDLHNRLHKPKPGAA